MPTYNLTVTKLTANSYLLTCRSHQAWVRPLDSPPTLAPIPTMGGNVIPDTEPAIDATSADYAMATKKAEEDEWTFWASFKSSRASAIGTAIDWIISQNQDEAT